MAKLQKELAEKKELLSNEENQMKVLSLEKELMEKKLKLETLEQRKQAVAAQKLKDAEAKDRAEIFETLAAVSKNMSSAASRNVAFSHLKARMKNVQAAIAQTDTDEKSDQARFDKLKLDGKVAKLLVATKKKNHREHAKAKALKTAEFADLERALQSIEKSDVNGVEGVLEKMKQDTKKLQAQSGDFLH